MIDMILTEEDLKNEHGLESVVMDKSHYPHGLKIHLDPKTLKKLKLKDVPQVGKKFMMLAKVEVSSVSKDESYGDEGLSACFQITQMDIQEKQESSEQEIGDKLYGGE